MLLQLDGYQRSTFITQVKFYKPIVNTNNNLTYTSSEYYLNTIIAFEKF